MAPKKVDRNKEFKDSVRKKFNGEYELLSSNTRVLRDKAVIRHKCGYTYKVNRLENFLSTQRDLCPLCNRRKTKKMDTYQYKLRLKALDPEYELRSKFINVATKVTYYHKECGRTFDMKPRDFKRGQRCSLCFGTPLKTTEEFRKEVHLLSSGEYELVSEYVNTYTHVKVKHLECGNIYPVQPRKFISENSRCPICNDSKSGKFVRFLLEEANIAYEVEKKYDELNNLRFDFLLKDFNILLELDGAFHFIPYYGEDRLKAQRERDLRKNNFCLESKDLTLVRIPYKSFTSKVKSKLIKFIEGLKNDELFIDKDFLFISDDSQDLINITTYFDRF